MKTTRTRGNTVLLGILALLLVVFLVAAVLLGVELWEKHQGAFPERDTAAETLKHNGVEYVLKDSLETFLFIGLDTFEESATDDDSYNNDRQADFLMLLVLDNAEETCRVIHVNRDSMAEMNVLDVASNKIGTVTKQIALAHTYGNGREVSCQNTANAVSELLMDINVDHYVSVTMDAVPMYNDFVGGITLEILDDFTATDPAMVQGATLTLTGEQALRYVRSRHGLDDPTNNHRMKRQKQYLEALYSRARTLAAEDEEFIARAALKLEEGYLVTDCLGNKLTTLLQKVASYELKGVLDIAGETKMGEQWLEFYPDEESVKDVVAECFYEAKK